MISRFSSDDIAPRLTRDFGFTDVEARTTADILLDSDPRIQDVFLRWWLGGPVDDTLQIGGYTAQRLVAEERLHPVAAFTTLEWIRRDPQEALSAIHGGHDDFTLDR
jgi:hypothetical protein